MDDEFLSVDLPTDGALHWSGGVGHIADSRLIAGFGLRAGERGTDSGDGLGLGPNETDEIRSACGSLPGDAQVKGGCKATSGDERVELKQAVDR
jgi:hypothetical protein